MNVITFYCYHNSFTVFIITHCQLFKSYTEMPFKYQKPCHLSDRCNSSMFVKVFCLLNLTFIPQKIPLTNVLGTKLAGHAQRFYFDTKSDVILPGDTLKFPFIFKSPNAGIFTETWELMTRPTLCGGAPIRITLRGNENGKYL